MIQIPILDSGIMVSLIPFALAIAVLGIESLLTSVVMDKETGTKPKHNSNKELIGNVMSGLLGGWQVPAQQFAQLSIYKVEGKRLYQPVSIAYF